MAKVRTSLLLFLSVLVAVAVGISLLLKVYLPRPEAVARLSQLLSRSFGLEIAIERVAVPWGWTGLGSVVLHDVAVSGPRVDGEGNTPLFRAQSMELRPSFLPLIWGELKLRWIEVEGPELRFEGRPLKACDVAFAYLQQALEGWTDLARGAHRLPVERLTLKKGVLSMAGVRLTDVEFRVEGWGSPTPHVHLSGELTVSGGSLPFQAGVQVSSPSELPSSTSTTAGWPGSGRSPFHMAAWIRFERVPLAPLQPLVPILDLKASRATALLTLVVSSEKEVEGALEARTEEVFIQGGKEPWESTLRARFRVEPAKGEASVSDVFLTAPGVQAKGVGKAGCSGEGVSYAIQMKDLVLILAELGGKVPGFAEAVGGRVAVQAFEAAGVWPDRPAELKLDGLVEEMGPFAFRSVRLLAISGQWQVEGGLDRLKAKAVLNAKAEGVGRAEVIHMALNGTIQGNLWKGDFTLEPMRVQIDPLGKSNLVVRLKEWGRATAELAAGPIELDLTELNHLVASLQGGLKVEALESPSLRLTRKAGQASWEAWMEFRTISLRTSGHPMTLLGTTVKLFSRGIRGIEGTLLSKALSLSGHDLEGLTFTFALHEGRLTGTLSLEKVGVHPTWQRGQPLTFSFDIPFAFEDGLLEVPEFSL
ncbi:MAG: hypothetical protein HYZ81_25890, partial [Nitrospinae bacterium]|nr:hypothetical protein [Nitrospinota bacterium]